MVGLAVTLCGRAPVGWCGDVPPPETLTIAEATLRALEQNAAFQVERFRPEILRTFEADERAAFDPAVSVAGSVRRAESGEDPATQWTGAFEIDQTLSTGTRLAAGLSGTHWDEPRPGDVGSAEGAYGLSVTQPLLRGRGRDVQRARLRLARYDTRMAQHALRGAAEWLVARVEQAAWDYVLAGRRIAIFEESMRIAENQRAEVEERIRIGRLADIELAAVAAEVAQRREDLINAHAMLARRRLELWRVVGPRPGGWDRDLQVSDEPVEPAHPPDPVEVHVQRALLHRADLQEARLRVARGEVELVRTRNGLLPRLDAFIAFGRTGYADSFASAYGSPDRTEDALEVGLRWISSFNNRRERAAFTRSVIDREQAMEALRNMEELVEFDVRVAHIEVWRTLDQIAATRSTRHFREESFRAEIEKLRVGRTTSILVAQAQRDLAAARIGEEEAVIHHLKARLQLDLLDGMLLEQRGIQFDDGHP